MGRNDRESETQMSFLFKKKKKKAEVLAVLHKAIKATKQVFSLPLAHNERPYQ